MSLKDDFLEALRSVKRDFLRDYDDTPVQQEASRPEPSRPTEHIPPVTATDTGPELYDQDREYSGPTETIPARERPHIRDTFQPELHTPAEIETPVQAADEQLEPNPADDRDSYDSPVYDGVRPASENGYGGYSEYNDASAGGNGGDGNEPPDGGDGRYLMDFDSGDMPGDERTVISKNTVIRGALQTEDSVRMFGQVLGDIECRSNILVAGKVRGNTSAANAYVINAQVDGNVLCDDVINVTDDAWILGNIRAQQADIDGKIKGNIEIRHSILVGSNSSVIGNISTDELEIKRGAFVNGQIMMYSPSRDVIDRFDSFDQ